MVDTLYIMLGMLGISILYFIPLGLIMMLGNKFMLEELNSWSIAQKKLEIYYCLLPYLCWIFLLVSNGFLFARFAKHEGNFIHEPLLMGVIVGGMSIARNVSYRLFPKYNNMTICSATLIINVILVILLFCFYPGISP